MSGRAVVAVWGLAYKNNTRSTKISMALRVIENLRGRAEVRAYDPLVKAPDVDVAATLVESRDAALVGADCLLILTDWDEFAMPGAGFRAMRHPVVIDCVGVLDAARQSLPGVEYVAMGRPVRR
jgi:UDPglucose 6-dehydrogenase